MDTKQRVFTLFEEFKKFALKGNVIDLAVAVIIGTAFGKIVDSLVKSIIMPLIGAFMPGDNAYVQWQFTVNGVTVPYGQFLGEVVNFLIIALALYVFIVKFLGFVLHTRKEEAAAPPPPLTKDQELLTEIRDLLQKSQPR